MLLDVDLTDPELYRQGFPHDLFTELRARGAVLHHPARRPGPRARRAWSSGRWCATPRCKKPAATGSASRRYDGPTISPASTCRGPRGVYADPPTHTRLRKLIAAGFTPRMIARLDDQVQLRADEILDAVVARAARSTSCATSRTRCRCTSSPTSSASPRSTAVRVRPHRHVHAWPAIPRSGLTEADREREDVRALRVRNRARRREARPPRRRRVEHPRVRRDRRRRRRADALCEFQLDLFFIVLSVAGSETTRNAISHGLLALVERPRPAARCAPTRRCGTPPPTRSSAGRAR